MESFFNNYASSIIFLHVMSAVIWVGGMIAIRFGIHYSMQNIDEPKIKLERTLENLKRFFNMVIPCIVLLVITAIVMIYGLSLKQSPLYDTVIIKEALWSVMSVVFITIYIKRYLAQKAFKDGDFTSCKKHLIPIAQYYIPLNIVLGSIAIYLGISIRGF